MEEMKQKLTEEINLRSNVTGNKHILTGGEVEERMAHPTAVRKLDDFEGKLAANGYTDNSITDKLRTISREDANLNVMTNLATTPGEIIKSSGGAAADLGYNKDAKELEAEAARDGATQSFLFDKLLNSSP